MGREVFGRDGEVRAMEAAHQKLGYLQVYFLYLAPFENRSLVSPVEAAENCGFKATTV